MESRPGIGSYYGRTGYLKTSKQPLYFQIDPIIIKMVTAVKPLQFQDEWRALEQNLILFCRITGVMRITPTIFSERGQTKKLNSNVRGLCNGPCTQCACVRARFELVIDFSF